MSVEDIDVFVAINLFWIEKLNWIEKSPWYTNYFPFILNFFVDHGIIIIKIPYCTWSHSQFQWAIGGKFFVRFQGNWHTLLQSTTHILPEVFTQRITSLAPSVWTSGPRFNIEMPPYQYSKCHCGYKTVVRSSYLHNGISYTGKTTSLYRIGAPVIYM